LLFDPALLENDDLIRVGESRQTLRAENNSHPFVSWALRAESVTQAPNDLCLDFDIDSGEGVVQYEDARPSGRRCGERPR